MIREDLSYTKASAPIPGSNQRRRVARFHCIGCDAEADFPLVVTGASGTVNPEATVKRAEREGWSCRGPRVHCPKCSNPQPKAKPVATIPPAITRPAAAAPAAPAVSTVKLPDRVITQGERLAIRTSLDTHFDDSRGQYLEGYSDQRVAETLGVPRIFVTNLREAAWGPLREDPPEIKAAELALANLSRIATESRTAATKAEELARKLLNAAEDCDAKVMNARKALGLRP